MDGLKYDFAFFDAIQDRRNTDCFKWDSLDQGAGQLPMGVADMDFRSPTEVVDALTRRAAQGIYGYTTPAARATDALLGFLQRRHGLRLTADQQCLLPCVVTGLRAAVRTLTAPGDSVIVQPPVYGPFYSSVEENHRVLVKAPLLRDAHGAYTMDLEAVQRHCKAGAKLMLLCNPHNPVGRCWTVQELTELWDLLARYGVALISDEIHWDFIAPSVTFTSALSLPGAANPDAAVAVLTSASKTFNLAGLQQAVLLTRNPALLAQIQRDMDQAGVTTGNLFALLATEVACRDGDAWLDALLAYLETSKQILAQELSHRLPLATFSPIQATYLAWLDLRAYGFTSQQLSQRTHAAGVVFSDGTFYGPEGEGFLRINLACPHSQLREALVRLQKALG